MGPGRSRNRVRILALWAGLAAVFAGDAALASPSRALTLRGKALVTRDCARCHAVGRGGASPLAAAPPFRRLHERYDVDALAEGLAEGLTVGHGPMPEWVFTPPDVEAIVAYLKSIQVGASARRAPAPR